MENLDLNESVKASEGSGSNSQAVKQNDSSGSNEPVLINNGMTAEDIAEQKRKIVELSNESILHGYDMAVDVLMLHGADMEPAVKLLIDNRPIIVTGLQNTVESRIQANDDIT